MKLGAEEAKAQACGQAIAKALTKDTLHFFTETEAQAFADYAREKGFDAAAIKDKEIHKLAKKVFNPAIDGLDIALFGRMVAQAAELNVEAAASFSHAISTHAVNSEVEFFTALDDLQQEDDTGSAHMGSLEFNSATYYRYISLDLGQLWQTLNGEGMQEAISAFTKALFIAIPAARQATQSGACGWDYARILVRQGQRLQLSFEKPVRAIGRGFLEPSIEALEKGLAEKRKMAGSLFGEIASYQLGGDSELNIDGLVKELAGQVEACHA